MGPVELGPNVLRHQYRGGHRIRELRELVGDSEFEPEEWIGSTTTLLHDPVRGLARVAEGHTTLRTLIESDPAGWLGPLASGRHPGDSGVLFKLLDAGQRLPVHVHPDRSFASSHLSCAYGKTEAWLVLDAEPGAGVYLGWTAPVDSGELAERRDAQDASWLLARMNRLEVRRGMSIVVPAGMVHAVDGGVFIAEIQEPTDFSIVIEWSATTLKREQAHIGVGWTTAARAIDTEATGPGALASLVQHNDLDGLPAGSHSLLTLAARSFFSLSAVTALPAAPARVAASFAVGLVLTGEGHINSADGGQWPVRRGRVCAIPHSCGEWRLSGNAQLLLARPAPL